MALEPFIAQMLRQLSASGRMPLQEGTPESARAAMAAGRAALGTGPGVHVEDIQFPTRAGHIPGRMYRPDCASGSMTFFHGGGWTIGDLDDFDALARHLCSITGSVVALPAYRLAPEFKFPAAHDDAVDVLAHLMSPDSPFGKLRERMIVIGDSAGGNLAVDATLSLGDGRMPKGLVLAYPVTDSSTEYESYSRYSEGYVLSSEEMEWFRCQYFADLSDRRSPRVVLVDRKDLNKLPPTLIIAAEYDILRDEAARLAERIGPDHSFVLAPGVTHGFLRLVEHSAGARTILEAIATFVGNAWQAGLPSP